MKKFFLMLFIISVPANFCVAQSKDQENWLETGEKIRQVFNLAKDSGIRTELEIVDSQVKKLEELKAEYIERGNEISAETKSLAGKEAQQVTSQMWQENHKTTLKEIEKILLPHQVKRLNQIARQSSIKFVARGDRFKMYIVIANQMGLSDSELKAFQKKVMKEKQEYEQNLRELMKKTDQAVFRHLPKKAQKRVDELFGDIRSK